jgi:hypothetical protein
MYMHEAFGAQLPNSQILAGRCLKLGRQLTVDTFAKELDARVYIPDFFDGSPVPLDVFTNPEARKNFDLKQFNITNSKYARESWMRDAARTIRNLPGVQTLGVVGVISSQIFSSHFSIVGAQMDCFSLQTRPRSFLMPASSFTLVLLNFPKILKESTLRRHGIFSVQSGINGSPMINEMKQESTCRERA